MVYAQGLIDMLNKYPHLTRVFINATGEWMFQPTEGFSEVSRDSILKGDKPATEETNNDNKVKKRK